VTERKGQTKPAGSAKKPAGSAKKAAGSAKKPAGSAKKPAGSAKKAAGSAKKAAGSAKKAAGSAKSVARSHQSNELDLLGKKFRNQILCGDAVSIMREMPSETIDLVVTSPPYNLKNSTGNGMKDGRGGKWSSAALLNGYAHHHDNMPHEEYVAWQRECLSEAMRLIKPTGAIFYNHKWRVQGGLLQDRQDIVEGFPVRQIIIWRRKGGINFNKGYFLPTYEVIYLIAKKDFTLVPKANAVGDVWEFMQETSNDHPAPFPVALIERIIGSTTAQVVLDPFMGSGTTAVAAMNLGRDFVGIDVSPDYCKAARERIATTNRTLFANA
jgi:site-specific DNA-methyltransferase (adenine-specific)